MMDVLQWGNISLRILFPFLIIQDYPDVDVDVDDAAAATATASDDDNDDANGLGEKDLFH